MTFVYLLHNPKWTRRFCRLVDARLREISAQRYQNNFKILYAQIA